MNRVFVYGTLKKGYGNHGVMQRAGGRFVEEAVIDGFELYAVSSYPGVIRGKGLVKGEVYDVPDEGMVHLDRLEGVPYLYQPEATITIDGQDVLVYLYQPELRGSKRLHLWPEVTQNGQETARRPSASAVALA